MKNNSGQNFSRSSCVNRDAPEDAPESRQGFTIKRLYGDLRFDHLNKNGFLGLSEHYFQGNENEALWVN